MISARLRAMIRKELLAVLRDARGRIMLIVPPLLQLVLFSAAATLEVRNVDIGVYDRSGGVAASEFVSELAGSPNVRHLVALRSPDEARRAIDDQQVIAVVILDQQFDRDVAAGRGGAVDVLLDGRRSNAAQIVAGYLERIAASSGAAVRAGSMRGGGESESGGGGGAVVSHWFNPNLDYLWFIMPAMVVTICGISALSVTAQSVARERELGTFDQLMVSPMRLHEILIGKMAPPFLAGMVNATLYLMVIPLIFGVPFRGSVLAFYAATTLYLLALIGVGMVVSAMVKTQQQAFLGMFLVVVPMTLLSGFAAPVANMPPWLQIVAQANPQKHFLVICEGLFLKAMPLSGIVANGWPLAMIAAVTLGAAVLQFRSHVE